ncbi:MAG: porin [Pseudomonadota bacterium]
MTLAKRLLLGSAASMMAVSGAHAADLGLPVAPAVDFVQICSIGAFTGFVLPGSDICFDISGSVTFNADFGGTNGADGDDTDDSDFSAEASVNFDARTMTDLGLLRGFIGLGEEGEGEDFALTVEKAFIEVGGFALGLTDSFFDPVYTDFAVGDVGAPDGGTDDLTLFGYSLGVGNGVSLSASIEDNDGNDRFGGIVDVNNIANIANGVVTAANADIQDQANGFAFVAAARVDQAWGSAKIAGAIVEVDVDGNDLVDEEIGFAVQASTEIGLPFGIDSSFGLFGIYTEGAIGYIGGSTEIAIGQAITFDAVQVGNELELTQVISLGAGFEYGLTENLDLEFDTYYAEIDQFGSEGDIDIFAIRGGASYRPVNGLEVQGGIAYTSYDTDPLLDDLLDEGVDVNINVTRSF